MDGSASQQQEEQRQLAERERALQEDAEWKRLQRDTFERWLNEQLKTSASASAGPVDLMVYTTFTISTAWDLQSMCF